MCNGIAVVALLLGGIMGSAFGGGGNKHPLDVLANVGTGGLYGVGRGLASGRPLQAASSLGPYGEVAQPTLGTRAALSGDLAGAGAGIGGALAGAGAGGGGGGGALDLGSIGPWTPSPIAWGSSVPGAIPTAGEFVEGLGGPSSALRSGEALDTFGGGGSGGLSPSTALAGHSALNALQQMLAPHVPASFPIGGALSGAGGATPAQIAAGAAESTKHPGLAPYFYNRMRGGSITPGISETTPGMTSMQTIQNYPGMF